MDQPATRLLINHHVSHEVLQLIEEATECVVLVSAYIRAWPDLSRVIQSAVSRSVRVCCILRSADGSRRERDKTEQEIESLKALGVDVFEVPRLHAKVYLSESQAIISSFNLVGASRDSIELAVQVRDPSFVADCIAKLESSCSGFSLSKRTAENSVAARPDEDAFCIGCQEPLVRNPQKPLCTKCYRSSRRGSDLRSLGRRCCHLCGQPHEAELLRPICKACWKSLPKAVQLEIKSGLAG